MWRLCRLNIKGKLKYINNCRKNEGFSLLQTVVEEEAKEKRHSKKEKGADGKQEIKHNIDRLIG